MVGEWRVVERDKKFHTFDSVKPGLFGVDCGLLKLRKQTEKVESSAARPAAPTTG